VGIINEPLDSKPALTKYTTPSHDPDAYTSKLLLEIETGRLHQIRRHLASIGHPVMGDPRYGKAIRTATP
jgi:tRNA pseudouridine32 synthase / 23S rRNA pseudouridine746 synthase